MVSVNIIVEQSSPSGDKMASNCFSSFGAYLPWIIGKYMTRLRDFFTRKRTNFYDAKGRHHAPLKSPASMSNQPSLGSGLWSINCFQNKTFICSIYACLAILSNRHSRRTIVQMSSDIEHFKIFDPKQNHVGYRYASPFVKIYYYPD